MVKKTSLKKIKYKLRDYYSLLFKSAHFNHQRFEDCEKSVDGKITCTVSFDSYLALKRFQKKVRRVSFGTSSVVAIIVITSLITQMSAPMIGINAATFNWPQTDWTGGAEPDTYIQHGNTGTTYSSSTPNMTIDSSGMYLVVEQVTWTQTTQADFMSGDHDGARLSAASSPNSLEIAIETNSFNSSNKLDYAGTWQTCFLQNDGDVSCVGRDNYSQSAFYDGSSVAASGVSVGSFHSCILKSDGDVDCRGNDNYGQATDYTGGLAVGVATKDFHTCVLESDGNVDCYGQDTYGQATDYAGGDAIGVDVGIAHTCILKSDGNVDCYGRDNHGQSTDYTGGDAIGVSLGDYHTCILKLDGNVDCYGDNDDGQAADYNNGDAIGVSAGSYFTCILKSDGDVDCYGDNDDGQADDYNGGDAIGVSSGAKHRCIMTSDGDVDCNGRNDYSQADDYTGGDAYAFDNNIFYYAQGTYTSAIHDTLGNKNFGNISWNNDAIESDESIQFKVRSFDQSDASDATIWASCDAFATTTDISSDFCVEDGQRYLQYQVMASSSVDQLTTPTLDDVSVQYNRIASTASSTDTDTNFSGGTEDQTSTSQIAGSVELSRSVLSKTITQTTNSQTTATMDSDGGFNNVDISNSMYATDIIVSPFGTENDDAELSLTSDDNYTIDDTYDINIPGMLHHRSVGNKLVSLGDVNGDGYEDVIDGQNGMDIKIYYGASTIDGVSDLAIYEDSYRVSPAGDVNGDGYDDVIVGYHLYNTDAGIFYIYYGGTTMDNVADLFLEGSAGDQLGGAVAAAGDVNNDGFDDVMVSAIGYDGNKGRTYIYYGGNNMDTVPDFIVDGTTVDNSFGKWAEGVGDLNGDGYDDVVIGEHSYDGASANMGRAHIYYGGYNMDTTVDFTITGDVLSAQIGLLDAAVGDLNGDGYDDMLLPGFEDIDIYFGDASMDVVIDLTLPDILHHSIGPTKIVPYTMDDINSDGYDDVIVGTKEGVYVYYGGATMDNVLDITLTNPGLALSYSRSLAVVDADNNGYMEIFVGSPDSGTWSAAGGEIFIYNSSTSPVFASSADYKSFVDTGIALNDSYNTFVWSHSSDDDSVPTIKVQSSTSSTSPPAFDGDACTGASPITLNTTCADVDHRYLWYETSFDNSSDTTDASALDSIAVDVDINIYSATGTFASSIFDTGGSYDFSKIDWTENSDLDKTDIEIKIRTCDDASCSGEDVSKPWADCSSFGREDKNSTIIYTVDQVCITNGEQYYQYYAELSTKNNEISPELQDISLTYEAHGTSSSELVSAWFNSTDASNVLSSIKWEENSPTGTDITLQLRVAPDSGSSTPGAASSFQGPAGEGTFFSTSNTDYCSKATSTVACFIPATGNTLGDTTDNQWMQYRLYIESDNGASPLLSSVDVFYVGNGTPEVTSVNSVEQISDSADSDFGKINIPSYTLDDIDGSILDIFVGADLGVVLSSELGIISASIDLAGNYDSLPIGVQTIQIDEEQIICSSRSAGTLSGCSRAQNSTRGATHDNGSVLWIIADNANLTGTFGAGIASPGTYSMVWDVVNDLNQSGAYSATARVRVIANDGQLANQVSVLATSFSNSFILDAKKPTVDDSATSYEVIKVDARESDAMLDDQANFTIKTSSEDSGVEYRYSTNSVLDGDGLLQGDSGLNANAGTWIADNTLKTTGVNLIINLSPAGVTDEPRKVDTVYVQFRDDYGNISGANAPYSVTTPERPTAVMIQDITNTYTDPNETGLFITWKVTDLPNDASEQGEFGSYKVERAQTTGANPVDADYSLVAIISNKNENYYRDGSVPYTGDENYFYRIYVTDAIGNISYYSATESDDNAVLQGIPNGTQDPSEGGGGSVVAAVITHTASTQATSSSQSITVEWTTDQVSNSSLDYVDHAQYLIDSFDSATTIGAPTMVDVGSIHSVAVTGLSPDTQYHYRIRSTNASGVEGVSVDDYTITTQNGVVITEHPQHIANNDNVVITWETSASANSYVVYSSSKTNQSLDAPQVSGSDTLTSLENGVYKHSITVTSLSGQYFYYVRSTDAVGNKTEDKNTNIDNGYNSFYSVQTTNDVSPPIVEDRQVVLTTDTTAVISWRSDEVSMGKVYYKTSASGAYNDHASTTEYNIDSVLAISGLNNDTSYDYYIEVYDRNGNISSTSVAQFATLEAQVAHIDLSDPGTPDGNNVLSVTESGAIISWDANTPSIATLCYVNGVHESDANMAADTCVNEVLSDTPTKNHVFSLSGLDSETAYYYRIKTTDYIDGSIEFTSTSSPNATFATSEASDFVAPVITVGPTTTTSLNGATINITTDENSIAIVQYLNTQANFDANHLEISSSKTYTSSHNFVLSGLIQNQVYYYRVKVQDIKGNITTYDNSGTDYSFITTEDTSAAIISNISVNTTDTSANVTWRTDELSDSQISFGLDDSYGQTATNTVLTTIHAIELTGLTADTSYHYQIGSSDANGNLAQSVDAVFTTDGNSYSEDEMQAKEDEISSLEQEVSDVQDSGSSGGGIVVIDKTDKTAPEISSVKTSVVGDNFVVIDWDTNENANSMVLYGLTANNKLSLGGDVDSLRTLVTKHQVVVRGLSPSTTYHFSAVSQDSWANLGSSPDFSFTTLALGEDPGTDFEIDEDMEKGIELEEIAKMVSELLSTGLVSQEAIRDAIKKTGEPPMISGDGPSISEITSKSSLISWQTDRESNSVIVYYSDGDGIDDSKQIGNFSELIKDHKVRLTGMVPGVKYNFVAQSTDALGSVGASEVMGFVTESVPYISRVIMANLTNASIEISWQSNMETTTEIDYGEADIYGKNIVVNENNFTLNHSIKLTGLDSGQTYHFKVKGLSRNGELIASDDYTFKTLTSLNVLSYDLLDIRDKGVNISWKTNSKTSSEVVYTNLITNHKETVMSSEMKSSHRVELLNLIPGDKYNFVIKGVDEFGQAVKSDEFSFTTLIDTEAPIIEYVQTDMALISKGDKNRVQSVITWDTDELSSSELIFTEGAARDLQLEVASSSDLNIIKGEKALTTKHVLVVTSFNPGTVYTFKAKSIDESGNASYSKDYTVLTPSKKESVLQVIMGTFEDTFGWLKLGE